MIEVDTHGPILASLDLVDDVAHFPHGEDQQASLAAIEDFLLAARS